MGWQDAPEVQPSASWQDAPEVEPPKQRTLGEEAARQAGIAGRNVLSAVTSPVHIGASVLNKAVNALAGRQVFDPNPSARFEQSLTDLGFPEPTTGVEKFGQGMAQSAPAFALPATLPAQVAGNAALAAAQSESGQEGKAAVLGGTIGAGGHALSKTVGGLVTPTKEAKTLMDRGVALTPGQAAGTGSVANRVESLLASNPVSAVPIRGAQRRGVEEAKGTDLNKVADAMGKTLPNVVPDSGTAERLIANMLPTMLMGGGYGANELGFGTLGTGMLAAGALGSRPGARFMTGGVAGQKMLSDALRRATPAMTQAATRKDKK